MWGWSWENSTPLLKLAPRTYNAHAHIFRSDGSANEGGGAAAAIHFIAHTDANDENEDLSALHYAYEFFARTDSLECEFWGVRLSLIKLREILETSPPQVNPPGMQHCIQSDNEVVVRYCLGFYVKIAHDKVLLAQQCRTIFREMQ